MLGRGDVILSLIVMQLVPELPLPRYAQVALVVVLFTLIILNNWITSPSRSQPKSRPVYRKFPEPHA